MLFLREERPRDDAYSRIYWSSQSPLDIYKLTIRDYKLNRDQYS